MQNPFDQFDSAPKSGPVFGAPAKVDPYAAKKDARDERGQDIQEIKLQLDLENQAQKKAEDAKKLADEEGKLSGAKAATASKLRRIIAQIGSIEKDANDNNGWFETGTSGALARKWLPEGTAGSDLAASLKTVDAENAFAALQALGEQGVKLTPISNAEIKLAAESVANLDPNQSQETFLKSINVARSKYADLLSRVAEGELRDLGFNLPQYVAEETRNQYPEAALFYYGDGANIIGYDKADGEHVSLQGGLPPSGGQTPSGPNGGGGLGAAFMSGVGDVVEVAGDLVGLVSNPLNAGINAVAGTNLSTDLGNTFREATGIPRGNPTAEAINKGGIGALFPAGAANALARGTGNVAKNVVTNALAQQPIQQGVGGATAGLASETVRQAGGGPVPQALAALGGGVGGFSGANAIAQRGANAAQPTVNALLQTGPGTASKASQRLIPNAEQVVRDGKASGVRVMTSDIRPPTTRYGKLGRTLGDNIPIAGTAGQRAKQQVERGDPVRKLMEDFGADDAAIDAVSADLVKTRSAAIGRLTDAKKSVIEGIKGAVPAPKAIAEIDKQVAKLKGIDDTAFKPVVDRLEAFKKALQSGKSLEQVEGQRRLLGDLFSDTSLASIKGDGQKAINAVYNPLKEDMGAFIAANGGPEAKAKWAGANDRLAAMAGELDASAFKNLLSNAETTPESAAKIIFGKTPSDMRRLYGSLSDKGRSKVRSAILFQAAEKSTTNDVISPQKFATAMEAMSKSTGVFFSPADKAGIDGMTRLIKATQHASDAAANLMTGAQNTPLIAGVSLSQIFGTAALPATATAGLLARAYESKAVRDGFLRLARTKPNTPQEKRAIQGIISSIAAANDNGSMKGFIDKMPSSPASAAAAERDDVEN